jgi:hypothetical protein
MQIQKGGKGNKNLSNFGIAEMLKCGSYEENIYHFNVGIATDLLRWYKPLQLFLREVLATIAMHVRLCTL